MTNESLWENPIHDGWDPPTPLGATPESSDKLVVQQKLRVKIAIAVVCFKNSFLVKKTGLLDIVGEMPIEKP